MTHDTRDRVGADLARPAALGPVMHGAGPGRNPDDARPDPDPDDTRVPTLTR